MALLDLLNVAHTQLEDGDPAAALVTLDEAMALPESHWRVWHSLARAHRGLGDLHAAVGAAEEGLRRLGPLPNLVEILFVYLARSGRGVEAVQRWEDLASSFNPRVDPAASTLAHLVVCFIQAGERERAVRELGPLLTAAIGTSDSKLGLMEFNVACLYALEGHDREAAEWALRALDLGYEVSAFDDSDFEGLRAAPVFSGLMSLVRGERRAFDVWEGEGRRVVVIARGSSLERLEWADDVLVAREAERGDLVAVAQKRAAWLAACESRGLVETGYDFATEWVPALEVVLRALSGRVVERLLVEWDEGAPPGLDREYSVVEPVELHERFLLPRLPDAAALRQVVVAAQALPAWAQVQWAPGAVVVHAEHDVGDEFEVPAR